VPGIIESVLPLGLILKMRLICRDDVPMATIAARCEDLRHGMRPCDRRVGDRSRFRAESLAREEKEDNSDPDEVHDRGLAHCWRTVPDR
jgi:hypothetical protein